MAKTKKREDGRYQRSITIGYTPEGKQQRKTIYAKTQKELEMKVAAFRQARADGLDTGNDKMTFGELAELWFEKYKPTISVNTRKKYRSILDQHLLPSLAHYKLKELKPFHLQSIINELAEDDYATATMREIKVTAAQIMAVAFDNDMVKRNVFEKITVPKVDPAVRRPLTKDESKLVERTYREHRMGVPAMLLLYCGIRRGELLALTWRDVDLQKRYLDINKAVYFDANAPVVKPPKTKASIRKVPIPNRVYVLLGEAKQRTSSMMVCPSTEGTMMTQIAFKRAWQSYMHFLNIAAGGRDRSRSNPKVVAVDNLTPHMFRHTYATMLYDAGVDIKSAQRFLGHADVVTTLRVYTHLTEDKEQEAIDALNRHFDGAPEKHQKIAVK